MYVLSNPRKYTSQRKHNLLDYIVSYISGKYIILGSGFLCTLCNKVKEQVFDTLILRKWKNPNDFTPFHTTRSSNRMLVLGTQVDDLKFDVCENTLDIWHSISFRVFLSLSICVSGTFEPTVVYQKQKHFICMNFKYMYV